MSTYCNLVRERGPLIAVFANLRSFFVVTIIFIIIKSKLAGVNRQSRIMLVCFVFPFQSRWYLRELFFSNVVLCTCIIYVCIICNRSKQIPWRISRGLNWENKTHKLKRSITSILMGKSCIYISLNKKIVIIEPFINTKFSAGFIFPRLLV